VRAVARGRIEEKERTGDRRRKSFDHYFVLAALVYATYTGSRKPLIPNVCPIDGQAAEWSKRQGRNDCEYGHFSAVEKTTHTWSARCR
jgi:hypothetical protein